MGKMIELEAEDEVKDKEVKGLRKEMKRVRKYKSRNQKEKE